MGVPQAGAFSLVIGPTCRPFTIHYVTQGVRISNAQFASPGARLSLHLKSVLSVKEICGPLQIAVNTKAHPIRHLSSIDPPLFLKAVCHLCQFVEPPFRHNKGNLWESQKHNAGSSSGNDEWFHQH